MDVVIRGSAAVRCAPLSTLESSSAEGLTVAAWADRPARLARMDRLCALALVACDGALVDAGLSPSSEAWRPERTGIVLGTAFGCHATNEAYDRGYRERGADGASPRLFAYTLPSSPVGEISIHHRIHGPATTQVGGLTAALDALAEALRHLERGRADRILVAAADVMTPTVNRLGSEGRDAACALLLERGEASARITGVARRYVAGEPLIAARELLAGLPKVGAVHGPAALHSMIGETFADAALHALDETLFAAAPLTALREAMAAQRPALVVATDPSGLAAVAAIAL